MLVYHIFICLPIRIYSDPLRVTSFKSQFDALIFLTDVSSNSVYVLYPDHLEHGLFVTPSQRCLGTLSYFLLLSTCLYNVISGE